MSDLDVVEQPGPAGELAQRIAARRRQLGLSRDELAAKAEIDAEYLEYLEHRAGAVATAGAMLRLAAALETTLSELAGSPPAAPPAGAVGDGRLRPLDRATCLERLAAGDVGRIVFVSARGPVAYPVNYAMSGGAVVLSTSSRMADELIGTGVVGFEIDRIDEERREGWSVLVTGRAQLAAGRRASGEADRGGPTGADPGSGGGDDASSALPWAAAGRDSLVRIEVGEISGRSLHRDPAG
jgi:nitroimidazol reductase NimA-like FMN-containing flavoprotein (pyridoxamine 5'-phosphate oxidase superfamily)